MKSFDGYLKKKLGDSYVLLAGGGHKTLNDFYTSTNSLLPSRLCAYTDSQNNVTTLNDVKESGFSYCYNGTDNPYTDCNVLTITSSKNNGWSHQLAFKYSGGGSTGTGYDGKDLATRMYNGTNKAWTAWYTILTSGNVGKFALPITGGTVTGPIEISTGNTNNNYNEGLRITRANNSWAGITFGSTGLSGEPTGGWFVATNPNGQFIITPDTSVNTTGLTLTKNGDLKWRNTIVSLNGHTHDNDYVNVIGDTMTGKLNINSDPADYSIPTLAINYTGTAITNDYSIAQLKFGNTKYDAYLGIVPASRAHFNKDAYFFHINGSYAFEWAVPNYSSIMALDAGNGNLWVKGSVTSGLINSTRNTTSSASPIITINNDTFTGNGYCWATNALVPSCSNGTRVIMLMGKANSTANQSYIGYHHIADGSDSNYATIGLYAKDELLNVCANGNVGIGTTSPGYKLQVVGDLGLTSANSLASIYISKAYNNNTLDYVLQCFNSSIPNSSHSEYIEWGKAGSSYNSGHIAYNHLGNGSNTNFVSIGLWGNNQILNVTGKGNVGIGTNAPSAKLQVNGDMLISNTLTFSGVTGGNFNEGVRIQDAGNKWAGITLGATGTSGCSPQSGEVAWFIAKHPGGEFSITPNSSTGSTGLSLTSGGAIKWLNNNIITSAGGTINGNLTINGVGNNVDSVLKVNCSRASTWVYAASFLDSNLSTGHNVWINVGKANSTRNSFGLSWHHDGGDGSTSNYGAIEIWGVGNIQRWFANGTSWFTGNVQATNFYTTSDRNKKTNISSFSEHIRKFQLKDTEKWHYGVIAQEVPEMFRDGEEGNMTVNYNSILSYYVGELENKVKDLEEKVRHLENLNK